MLYRRYVSPRPGEKQRRRPEREGGERGTKPCRPDKTWARSRGVVRRLPRVGISMGGEVQGHAWVWLFMGRGRENMHATMYVVMGRDDVSREAPVKLPGTRWTTATRGSLSSKRHRCFGSMSIPPWKAKAGGSV